MKSLVRGQKLNTSFFFSNFSCTSGITRQNPGISRQRVCFPWVLRDIPNFLARSAGPPPLHMEEPPMCTPPEDIRTRKFGFVLFLLPHSSFTIAIAGRPTFKSLQLRLAKRCALGEAKLKPKIFQTGGFPTFFGERPGLCCRPFRVCSSQVLFIGREKEREKSGKSPDNPRTNRENNGKSGKSPKKDRQGQKKGRTSTDWETPVWTPPPPFSRPSFQGYEPNRTSRFASDSICTGRDSNHANQDI